VLEGGGTPDYNNNIPPPVLNPDQMMANVYKSSGNKNFNNSQESKKLNKTGNITKIEEEQDSDDQELEDDMKISDIEDFQQE